MKTLTILSITLLFIMTGCSTAKKNMVQTPAPTPQQQIETTSNVVLLQPEEVKSFTENIERAITEAFMSVPRQASVAVVDFPLRDIALKEALIADMEDALHKKGYTVADRGRVVHFIGDVLKKAGQELSNTEISQIGRYAGADVVLTARVEEIANTRRIRLRVLNTITMEIMGNSTQNL
jgi:hypothetical protein